mmetsp:Transcript_15412/g.39715  ORF Transcript_15412/g.39715 Transcript_15412/m.39715 type:complete len:218 (-) Transcript_15412:488-1141(-)
MAVVHLRRLCFWRDHHAGSLPRDPRARAQPVLQVRAGQSDIRDGGQLAHRHSILRTVPRLSPRAPQVPGHRRHRHRHPVAARRQVHPWACDEDDLGVLPDPHLRAAADVHQAAGGDGQPRGQLRLADRLRCRSPLFLGLEAALLHGVLHPACRRAASVCWSLHLRALRLPAPGREARDLLLLWAAQLAHVECRLPQRAPRLLQHSVVAAAGAQEART